MATENKTQFKSIFEVINQNIVDLSQDVVTLYEKVDAIFNVLFQAVEIAEPTDSGAEEETKE